MKCNRTKEKRSSFLSAEVTSYHFRSGGSNHHHFVLRARILAHVFRAFLLQFSFFFLVLQALGRMKVVKFINISVVKLEFYLKQVTSSRAVMPRSSRNQRRWNSKPRAVSRLRGYNVSPERPKRGRARENDGPRPSHGKERASSRPRSITSVVKLPDERHTKSRTRSRSRSPHQERQPNRSESSIESRGGNRT